MNQPSDPAPDQNQINNLVNLYKQGRLQEAARHGTALATQYPRHHLIASLLGAVYTDLGQKDEALASFRRALEAEPDNVLTRFNFGIALMRFGEHEAAAASFGTVLHHQPDNVEAHHNLGAVLMNLGKYDEAAGSFRNALRIKPAHFRALSSLGIVLIRLDRHEEAVACFREAVKYAPDPAEASHNLGVALKQLGSTLTRAGRYEEAADSFREVLQLKPDDIEACNNLGSALRNLNRYEEALACFDKALQLKPDFAEAQNNRGNTLLNLGRHKEAIACFRQALQIKPSLAMAHNNLGTASKSLHQYEEAIASYRQAIQIQPDFSEAHHNLGIVFMDLDRFDEAAECFRTALKHNPDYAEACYGLGNVLNRMGRRREGIDYFHQAVQADAQYLLARSAYLYQLADICDWERLDESALADLKSLRPGTSPKSVLLPFNSLALIDDAEFQQRVARAYAQANFSSHSASGPVRHKRRGGRIRIGYFSADFYNHATMHLMAELFERHDRDRFEIHAFSFGPDRQDALRGQLLNSVKHFHDVRQQGDHEIAALSRSLEIDIAVDLKGYTKQARPGIFACRAAPVQVNYLGYPSTMGAPFIDYLIADPILIPPESQQFYTEKIAYLPDSYQVNDSRRAIADTPTRAGVGLPDKGFVFCCFNNSYKITPDVFAIWMRLLAQVPDSVLWLFKSNELAPENLRHAAEQQGIAAGRLVFAGRIASPEHLARCRLADLFVDTFTVNAHTTASDALWAGLPVVTKPGESFVSRVAASLLTAVGLPELITATAADYEALALRLATHPAELKVVKEKLDANLATCPLFDTARYTRHLEAVYGEMIRRLDDGLDPDHFHVG